MDWKLKPEQTGFEELLESRLTELLAKVGTAATDEIESELFSLHSLIDQYKRHDELIETLIDPMSDSEQRAQIREALREQHLRNAENRAEAERLHARSRSVLEKSARLMAEIDRRVYDRTHKGSEYAPELCGFCRGIGGRAKTPCIACRGRRTVLVHQPPLTCPRCGGTGQPNERDRIQF